MGAAPIDLSAGMVPKSPPIDLSAGMVPKQSAPAPKGWWQTAKDNFNAGTQPPAPATSVLDMLNPHRLVQSFGAGAGDVVRSRSQPRYATNATDRGSDCGSGWPAGSCFRAGPGRCLRKDRGPGCYRRTGRGDWQQSGAGGERTARHGSTRSGWTGRGSSHPRRYGHAAAAVCRCQEPGRAAGPLRRLAAARWRRRPSVSQRTRCWAKAYSRSCRRKTSVR